MDVVEIEEAVDCGGGSMYGPEGDGSGCSPLQSLEYHVVGVSHCECDERDIVDDWSD